ncbi:MAG: type I restriction-modification enzyme R subunit C-terminal domain-containing protein [bacterium]
MKFSKIKALNIFNALLLIIALIQYYLLNPLNTPNETYLTTIINFDYVFKLIPGFLIPYLSIYLLLGFLLIRIIQVKENADMVIFLMSIILLWSIVNFGHGLLPTLNYLRPDIKEGGIFFEFVKDLYKSVKPFRSMPSWHAATATLCAIVYYKMDFRFRIPVIVWCVLICLSPLFLKMNYLLDVILGIPLAFVSFSLAQKISTIKMRNDRVQEIVKGFSVESLIQSIAIGIRSESTLNSLIESLTRIEKSLTGKDNEEIRIAGAELHPPVDSLKQVINNMILSLNSVRQAEKAKELFGKGDKSYIPSDTDLKKATEDLIAEACAPFENPDFRNLIILIKKRNSQLINTNSIEDAAKERSHNIIFRFNSFLESHKKDIPALRSITGINGHTKINFDEIKVISRELRKPPYEISPDEVWKAYYRIDNSKVKQLGEQKNPADIISLTQYALGKIDSLEPFYDKVDRNFSKWLEANKDNGRIFTDEELVWLKMMKNYFSSSLEINLTSFNETPFITLGGSYKADIIFGKDLNRIIHELNDKLI